MIASIAIRLFCALLLWAGYESLKEDAKTFGWRK